jgi:hypothetical protein
MPDDDKGRLIFVEGVWSVLCEVSIWSACERGSEFIEPLDLVRAIYIVDLERVADYWANWENYATFVGKVKLLNGHQAGYINRVLYLLQMRLALSQSPPGQLSHSARTSKVLYDIVFAAKTLANRRVPAEEWPSSRDLLFCACTHDADLSAALQQAGLQIDKLESDVKNFL